MIINSKDFSNFLQMQYEGKKFIRYNDSIRDLYPLEYHTSNKRIEDVNRFNELNGLILDKNKILSNENIITRRVTKKKIVYKKNKVNNIIAISIFKGYLNLYFSSIIEKYDDKNEVKIISERTCTNLDRVLVIKTNEDIIYAKGLLENYINELYNIILSSNKIS